MSRKRKAPVRKVYPDPKFHSEVVSKFINSIMYDGKRSTAEKILYDALDKIKLKNNEDPLKIFNAAISKGARAIEVDVIMTKDNQIICSHNYDMSIETELQEDASKIEYAKIQKANIFTNNKEEQEHIPKLKSVETTCLQTVS